MPGSGQESGYLGRTTGVFDDGDSPWHVPACFSTAAAVFEDGILSLIPISYGHRISVGRLPKAEPGSECPCPVLSWIPRLTLLGGLGVSIWALGRIHSRVRRSGERGTGDPGWRRQVCADGPHVQPSQGMGPEERKTGRAGWPPCQEGWMVVVALALMELFLTTCAKSTCR